MCLMCLSLEKEFSKFNSPDPKKNNDLATEYLKYLSLNPEQRCEFVKKFDFTIFQKTTDDDVLIGKNWAEVLKDSFKEIDELKEKVKLTQATLGSSNFYDPGAIKETPPEPIKVEPEKVSCLHTWMEYLGAGTRQPEIICRKCGCPKSDNKASP